MKKVLLAIFALSIGVVLWLSQLQKAPLAAEPLMPARSIVASPSKPVQTLSSGVAVLIDTQPVGFHARLEASRLLGNALSSDDRACLVEAMRNAKPEEVRDGEWHTIVNDIMQALRSQASPAPEVTDALIGLYRDVRTDPTVRDYALQHLREWYADLDVRSTHEERPEKRRAIAQCLWEAAQDSSSASGGTALLAWHEWTTTAAAVQIEREAIGRSEVDAVAIRIAKGEDERAFRGTRATALQVCAQRDLKVVLPVARGLAIASETDPTLRLSAIAAIGLLGDANDARLLRQIASGGANPGVLDRAVAAAVKRLSVAPKSE